MKILLIGSLLILPVAGRDLRDWWDRGVARQRRDDAAPTPTGTASQSTGSTTTAGATTETTRVFDRVTRDMSKDSEELIFDVGEGKHRDAISAFLLAEQGKNEAEKRLATRPPREIEPCFRAKEEERSSSVEYGSFVFFALITPVVGLIWLLFFSVGEVCCPCCFAKSQQVPEKETRKTPVEPVTPLLPSDNATV